MGVNASGHPISTGASLDNGPGPGPEPAEDVIDALHREHGLGLIRLAVMLTGDQQSAEDVVQDAFLGLHRNWHQVRDPASLPAYLRTAVVSGARTVHRSRGRIMARLHLLPRDKRYLVASAAGYDGGGSRSRDRRPASVSYCHHSSIDRTTGWTRRVIKVKGFGRT